MDNKNKRIGLIGLGAMGAPMARQILQKHGQVTVFDVDPGGRSGPHGRRRTLRLRPRP